MSSDEVERSTRTLPRLADVAARAGVSTATADRALNRRPGVRLATMQRVLRAAADLDYLVDANDRAAAAVKPVRIGFLLPASPNSYVSMLGRMIGAAQDRFAEVNMRARVDYIESFKPELLAQHLRKVGRDVDGVAFMALEHPTVREAVDLLAERGIPAVTLISDVANTRRVAYVGLDNRSAGRTAGYLIARFIGSKPAKVAMIAGSLSYRAHEEREMGFLHLFQELFPAIEVVGLREGHDEEARNYRQTKMLLAQHPDLAGIYNIGGGPEGIARALKEAGRQNEVVFVGHGLTAETRALLVEGAMDAVITQNPQATLMDCISIFANLRAGRPASQGVERPRTEIFLRENLP
ncbi:LacI family DNA-binding transcriptional regulator [Bosea caraganae]|uniref:LacI family DNA-binding transcriptional regulator n=1 Tax=Bosea caraganae TaxID=2763117 RepID=A0A370KY84_9HYPH|nr:LacI family DNA-binding transcriptional regulator [Bosea caraganae]RDJ19959.1 LacI family DNA-binding transcriptional regulator [Bosea caraganae]RDJ23898.1 LacI family DNA-binding transcriptional regulator [Bosea caraganae]